MTKERYSVLIALFALFVLCPVKGAAQESNEYVITVGNEQLRFVAQTEAGYVVKAKEKQAVISILSSTLSFLRAENAKPIRGLDRHGIWVVEDTRPAGENEKTIKMLRADSQIEYAAQLFSSNGETVAVIPEIVIRVEPGVDARQVHFLCESMALAIIKPMEFTTQEYMLQVLGPDAESVFTALENLNNVDWIEWAAPNTAFRPKLSGQASPGSHDSVERLRIASAGKDANRSGVFPNDEYFPYQWHLHNTGQLGGTPDADINAPEAWEITAGDPNIVVAVIDSGVDLDHPDLVSNLVPGYDFLDDDDRPEPNDYLENPHGTACAGLVAAQGNNGIGVSGVTWNCKIMPIRTYRMRPNGEWQMVTQADIATAFRWAANHGADIISNSWVSGKSPKPIIHSGIVDAARADGSGRDGKGCLVLFATANQGGSVRYPAVYPEVIAVGGTDTNDVLWHYSNYGPELDIVAPTGCWTNHCDIPTPMWTTDVSGPGEWDLDNIFDTSILDYTDTMGGTSGACPVAAGVAALILSIEPELTNEEVRHFLCRSAKDLGEPGRDDYYGWGRVDARAALDMVLAKRADLNNDWKVDLEDLLLLIEFWETGEPSGDIAPATRRDGIVDEQDLELLMQYWKTEIPEPGLIAHWKLDETEGEIAHDRLFYYDGTLNGDPVWQPAGGQVDGALAFDGIDDYVSTPFILDPADAVFSVFAWIKGGAPGQVIISQTNGAGTGRSWLCTDLSDGKLMTDLRTLGRGGGLPLMSESVITDAGWHRIGFVWDGSYRYLYVDGTEVAKDTDPQAHLETSEGGLYIGAGKNLEPGSFFSGLIDDVRIYNRVITP